MRLLIFWLFFISATVVSSFKYKDCECGTTMGIVSNRIVGGSEAHPHEYPWMVAIYNGGELHCGGSLINNQYVLTAGHCIRWSDPNKLTVMLGMHSRSPFDGKRFNISHTILNGNFYSHRLYDDNDIALIRLAKPVKFSKYVQPICLPEYKKDHWEKIAIVAGWGRTLVNGKPSNILKKTFISIMTRQACRNSPIVGNSTTDLVLCGYEVGTDACQGDSGGPLIYERWPGKSEQIGVVSWGIGCASPNIPGVYTKISEYTHWIDSNTKDSLYCKN